MKRLKNNINTAALGALAGVVSFPAASACNANCQACYGCAAAGGLIIICLLFRKKLNILRRK